MFAPFAYIRPTSLRQAARELTREGAMLHAGGTDLLGLLREHIATPGKVVSLSGIDGLRGVKPTADGGCRIGALTTITEVADDWYLREHYPALAGAASEVASPQLRHQGTIGGNLCQKPRCWYYRGEFDCLRKGGETCFAVGGEDVYHCVFGGENCFIVHPSDTAPALMAYGASVRLVSERGERMVKLEDFFVSPADDPTRETVVEPDEILVEIVAPPNTATTSAYRKVRARRSWDFNLAGGAFVLALSGTKVDSASVVLAGVAPVPWRSRTIEEAIIGKTLDEKTITAAAQAAVADAKPMRQNGYKVDLLRGVVVEELTRAAG